MVSNIILFTAQWFTIQPDLFGRIIVVTAEQIFSVAVLT